MITVIPTTTAAHLAKNLEKCGTFRIINPLRNKENRRYFPDGEVYIRLVLDTGDLDRVVLLHSGAPRPNSGLLEVYMILELLNQWGVKNIEVFFTYFPYCMQDHTFLDGELNAAEGLIKKLINYYKVKQIYNIEGHFHGREWVHTYPVRNISLVDQLIAVAQERYGDIVAVTPDQGAIRRTGIAGLTKKRINSYETECISDQSFADMIRRRVVAVIDDNLETGGTLCRFYDECKRCGADKAVALVTHSILPKGVTRVLKKYDDLITTNSIPRRKGDVDVSAVIAQTLLAE